MTVIGKSDKHIFNSCNKSIVYSKFMAEIERVFLQDDGSVASFHTIKTETDGFELVGEIFHNAQDQFKFTCLHCGDEFFQFNQFTNHVQTHLMQLHSNLFQGKIKEEVFDNNIEMPIISDGEVNVSTNANQCSSSTVTSQVMNCDVSQKMLNRDEIIQTELLSCALCDQTFASKNQLSTHLRRHTSIKHHPCQYCEGIFRTRLQFHAHLERRHNLGPAAVGDSFECTVCHESFEGLQRLLEHMIGHVSDLFSCDICSKIFLLRRQLYTHRRCEHNVAKYRRAERTPPRTFKCQQCGDTFLDKNLKIRHVRQHKLDAGVTPHSCHVCGRTFIEKCNLNRHLRTHGIGGATFTCDVCGKILCADSKRRYCGILARRISDAQNAICVLS